ncbi:MAG: T9SS type A sorting domain-containing protein [Bacteroidetes bacterium]|nr:T9SS type A sorting domain-containing protein [Bacteroidota bacterium]
MVSCKWWFEFSPSGQYLYVSTTMKLRQFDMLAPNIAASGIVIDSLSVIAPIESNSRMQLGPDNKLYIDINNGGSQWLHVIHQPDSPGFACNYDDTAITFIYPISSTMPNIPHYEIGAMVGSPCDTLSANSPPAPQRGEQQLYAIYNTLTQQLVVTANNIKGKNVTVSIYDGRGSLKFEVISLKSNAGYFTLDVDCAGWSDGLYVVHLQTEKEVLSKKFVKE